ncbi:MAG: glycosyltransferase [Lentisphaerae bacterium]|nr:glycosyltransferase [Lentisphaerota bacterium]
MDKPDHTATGTSISVVVPVYNSEGSLPELVARLASVLSSLTQRFEVILVNDGSRDRSWQRILELCERYDHVRGIDLMRNFGQHNALLCGIRAARYEVIVTMDDDLQHPPGEIPKLVAKLAEGYDVVYGTPSEKQHDLWRNVASLVNRMIVHGAMGAETARRISPFRVFRTKVRDGFANYQGSFVVIDVLLTWGTTRFAAVSVHHEARQVGRSGYTFRKLVSLSIDMMTGFSTLPLRFASVIGFAFSFIGLGMLVYVLGRYLIKGGAISIYAFVGSVVAFFAGAQLFALGIMGEYLARIHFRGMRLPSSVIGDTAGFDEKDHGR